MIKNLRRKFVIIAMSSTFAVLTVIILIINLANYNKVIDRADEMIDLLVENKGDFQIKPRVISNNRGPKDISPEIPFQTRFFTVTMDENGNVIKTDLGKIAAISEDEADKYAKKIFGGSRDRGFVNIYRYRVINSDDTMIVCLDCELNLDNFHSFRRISILVSGLGLFIVFILVLIFSKIVFLPVEESYEKQKQFITDAGHEIKTPLTIIDANTELIEMESGENQWTRSTKNQIKRLSEMTKKMITLSKLDEGRDLAVIKNISISDILNKYIQMYEVVANNKNRNILANIEQDVVIKADEKSIEELLDILFDNAVKYSLENSEIRINLYRKNKRIYLVVYNETDKIGIGNHNILFERFYRLDNSRNSQTGGSGIGLSVARAIVESYKGKISAYSEDGKSLNIMVEFKS